jgi:hypothetical protein
MYTGAPAYDPMVLQAPPVPSPSTPLAVPGSTGNVTTSNNGTYVIQLASSSVGGLSSLSERVGFVEESEESKSFWGFSIEFSVIEQVCECVPCFIDLNLPID